MNLSLSVSFRFLFFPVFSSEPSRFEFHFCINSRSLLFFLKKTIQNFCILCTFLWMSAVLDTPLPNINLFAGKFPIIGCSFVHCLHKCMHFGVHILDGEIKELWEVWISKGSCASGSFIGSGSTKHVPVLLCQIWREEPCYCQLFLWHICFTR